jgi:apolipoprotein N-acyltransferase
MNGDLRPAGARQSVDLSAFYWWGLFMVIVGLLWLADKQGWLKFDWSIIAPLALVFAGIMAFMPRRRSH